jgi:hypothetical protein
MDTSYVKVKEKLERNGHLLEKLGKVFVNRRNP